MVNSYVFTLLVLIPFVTSETLVYGPFPESDTKTDVGLEQTKPTEAIESETVEPISKEEFEFQLKLLILERETQQLNLLVQLIRLNVTQDRTSVCETCKESYHSIQEIVSDKDFERYFRVYLESFCRQIPKPGDYFCIKLVDDYLIEIIELIKSETPEDFCKQIGLC